MAWELAIVSSGGFFELPQPSIRELKVLKTVLANRSGVRLLWLLVATLFYVVTLIYPHRRCNPIVSQIFHISKKSVDNFFFVPGIFPPPPRTRGRG